MFSALFIVLIWLIRPAVPSLATLATFYFLPYNNTSMIQMLFFLRFGTQLRHTQPELILRLEDTAARAVEEAGGTVTNERRFMTASLDEEALGFWLDLLILIETMMRELDGAKAELYGYSVVLGKELFASTDEAYTQERQCRFLAGGGSGGGIFLDQHVAAGLLPYLDLEEPASWTRFWEGRRHRADMRIKTGNLFRVEGLKSFTAVPKGNALQETMVHSLFDQAPWRNTLFLGPALAGKREGLYRYAEERSGDFPPLVFRFGIGGLTALTDAWTAPIRSLAGAGAADAEEINGLWNFLFQDRLREELSPFVVGKARRFLLLLLEFYTSAARRRKRAPVLILENVQEAGKSAADLFIDCYAGIEQMPDLTAIGTWDTELKGKICDGGVKKWETVFPRIMRPTVEGLEQPRLPEMPMELLEIGYALSLLGRYFPTELFLRLFEEEGKNPVMISRAFFLLAKIGLIDKPRENVPWMGNFAEQAEAILGERGNRVRALVQDRLLAWVEQKKLNSCFRFLMIIATLGGTKQFNDRMTPDKMIPDRMILTAITSDLVNGTIAGIKEALEKGLMETLFGLERAAAVRYVFNTSRALFSRDETAIKAAFADMPPDCAAFPEIKAQALANISACHLGLRDTGSALASVKEAMLLSQRSNSFSLARTYRLFALGSISKQATGEAIDYLGFAMDKAEKSADFYELGVSAYYAAVAQFMYGSISRAVQLIRKSREQALIAGSPEWADYARFFEGRLAFEIGRYQEALDMFEDLREKPSGEPLPEKTQLLAAWAYRARIYGQNPLCSKPSGNCHDAALFEVEASYLAGNHHKTVELAAFNSPRQETFLHIEQPDWSSGFAQCELLYFSRDDLWNRMICAYHALALCRLSAIGGEEAIHIIQPILKKEQLSEMDPWDAFYFYAWYRILEQNSSSQVDLNTAVSMAFKRLQRRASRIEDIEIRRQFMFQSRWNSALSSAAKEFKLI